MTALVCPGFRAVSLLDRGDGFGVADLVLGGSDRLDSIDDDELTAA